MYTKLEGIIQISTEEAKSIHEKYSHRKLDLITDLIYFLHSFLDCKLTRKTEVIIQMHLKSSLPIIKQHLGLDDEFEHTFFSKLYILINTVIECLTARQIQSTLVC